MVLPVFGGCLLVVICTLYFSPSTGIIVAPFISCLGTILITIIIYSKVKFTNQIKTFSIFNTIKLAMMSVFFGFISIIIVEQINIQLEIIRSIIKVTAYLIPTFLIILLQKEIK